MIHPRLPNYQMNRGIKPRLLGPLLFPGYQAAVFINTVNCTDPRFNPRVWPCPFDSMITALVISVGSRLITFHEILGIHEAVDDCIECLIYVPFGDYIECLIHVPLGLASKQL